jgi:hypothetical protein
MKQVLIEDRRRLQSRLATELPEHLVRVEGAHRHVAGCLAVKGVIVVDLFQGRRCLLGGVEGEEPAARGNVRAETGFLRHHRSTRGEIAHAAVTEPPAACAGNQVPPPAAVAPSWPPSL